MPMRPRSGRWRVVRQRKSCSKFLGTRLFKTENLATLRIDAGHHMLDGAVFTGSVQCLKYQQQ